MASSKPYSMRELRMSSAVSSIRGSTAASRTSNILTPSASVSSSRIRKTDSASATSKKDSSTSDPSKPAPRNARNFVSAPSRTLNLAPATSMASGKRDWLKKADEVMAKREKEKKESKRVRKKREWLLRKEQGKLGIKPFRKVQYVGDWEYLPDVVLEMIFQYLSYEKKMNMVKVCENWGRLVPCKSIWSDFVVHDTCMTVSRFNFAGKFYEDVLDHQKASEALHHIGKKMKRLAFLPHKNLHNICSFQEMMTKFCGYYGDLANIQSFTYVFPCDFAARTNEVDIYGTGGTILEGMKNLLIRLPGLKNLELVDLQLEGVDALHVLDEVSEVCCTRLTTLKVVNISRMPFQMLAIASFVNLKVLAISPHNLADDLVECLGDLAKLRNIQIITNKYTECIAPPVDYRVWKAVRKRNPRLRVHLVTEGKHSNEIVFQEKAPVKSIIYDTPYTKASTLAVTMAVELYRTDLECYGHRQLPRFHMPKSFHDRADSAYLYLVRQCPYIHTLLIRERISSSTVLLLAYTGKNLRYFHVRRNAIMLKCDWPKSPEWSWDFYKWLKKNSRSYEDMEREVSQILGFRWYALNDKQFKLTPVNLNIPYYYEGFEEAD